MPSLRFVRLVPTTLATLALTGCFQAVAPIDPDAATVPPVDAHDADAATVPPIDAACSPDSADPACVTAAPPRPMAPLSTAIVTSRRPTLRWQLAPGTDGARVEICRTRWCVDPIASFDASGSAGAPAMDLPPGVLFWRLRGRAGAATGSTTSPTWEFTVGARSAGFDGAHGTVPDFDLDGFADVVAGAPEVEGRSGRVHVYPGAQAGVRTSPTVTLAGPEGGFTRYGQVVASAGDVNGDGYAELLVSATAYAMGVGRVYVYPGGPAGVGASPVATLVSPDGELGNFGHSVASAGDVNGDGYADVIVGAYAADRVGRAHVYFGSAAGLAIMPSVTLESVDGMDSYFGGAVAGAVDLNGDGFDDVVVGASGALGNTGRVHVYTGGPAGPGAAPAFSLTGPDGPMGAFGSSLASAGDVDGDGHPEVVIGAYLAGSGRVHVYRGGVGFGGAPAVSLTGPDGDNSFFGNTVAGVGDLNADGYDDVAIGGRGAGRSSGRARVYFGSGVGLMPMPAAVIDDPDGSNTAFGLQLAHAGDVDGDGFADVVVGSSGADNSAGRVYMFGGSAQGPAMLPSTLLASPDGMRALFGISVL